ncbi:hypothetical protein [Vibrio owensii]|uniref:hypothetical protein n=1 Tax=Vibrio owensii TaxID=696485 RepID=UPI002FF3ABC0
MKKFLPVSALILTACSAMAESKEETNEFYESKGGTFQVQAIDTKTFEAFPAWAKIYYTTDGSVNVGVKYYVPDDVCTSFEDEVSRANSFLVNGVKIRGTTQCTDVGEIMLYASSFKGRDYIKRQFSKLNSVNMTIDGISLRFSALGYNWFAKQKASQHDGL